MELAQLQEVAIGGVLFAALSDPRNHNHEVHWRCMFCWWDLHVEAATRNRKGRCLVVRIDYSIMSGEAKWRSSLVYHYKERFYP